MSNPVQCPLSNGFCLWEKVYAQFSFFLMGVVGMIGIARVDWRWLVPFLIVYGYGMPGIVMRHLTCPRCPHLFIYGDCLQFPPAWSKWLVKQRKTTPFSATERWVFYLIFLFIPVYPLFWLQTQPVLLGVFALSAGMWYLGQWFYFCKRCRVDACPFNRASVSLD